ncbi:MAG: carbamoyltransferase HypF [Pseudomonadota bacterium]
MAKKITAKQLKISGIVQGVGFRPFVYQLARQFGIKGTVANTSSGVTVHIEGPNESVDRFCADLTRKPPPIARITEVLIQDESVRGFEEFSIVASKAESHRATLISPDVSVCEDCLREIFDPGDRRHGYPFTNCTNCGPRYTIIDDIPYDRPNTSMKHFTMCDHCRAEYDDPGNRRFHAQPNACPVCGPHVTLHETSGKKIEVQSPIEETASLLKQGHIVAVKGLGGFHLAVDAQNHEAVRRLRKRKHREQKPLAVMSPNITQILSYAHVDPEEAALLASPQRPIVILKKKIPEGLSDEVSPKNNYFGAMLPYTPLHYLLLSHGFLALVMTSGNMSEEPIAIDNGDAFERLSGIADYFLVHNRDIYLRSDDSIVKQTAGSPRLIRRSRGYIPTPVFLKEKVPHILACGAELKNTVCVTKEKTAFLSQHIGDLENLSSYEFFTMTIDHMKRILDIDPEIVAYDFHPDYLSTIYAQELTGVEKVQVQHHHAHIVSCMAENRLDGPVIGLSFDGTGYGSDGAIWGGEVLVTEPGRFRRAAHMAYVPMPGSAAAIKEPWRMAVSYLYHTFGEEFPDIELPGLEEIPKERIQFIVDMIRKKVNSPWTSSLGRLFDGVAAITGIRNHVFYEGQAAMELEMMTGEIADTAYDYEWSSGGGIYTVLPEPVIRGVVGDVKKGAGPSEIGGKFHATLIRIFAELCGTLRKETGIKDAVLSGGVFQNSLLLTGLTQALEKKGFRVFAHSRVPTNDGGISLGQAVVAAAVAKG